MTGKLAPVRGCVADREGVRPKREEDTEERGMGRVWSQQGEHAMGKLLR